MGTLTIVVSICMFVLLQYSDAESEPAADVQVQADGTKCYTDPPVGCFPTTGIYRMPGGVAPQSPKEMEVQFIHHDHRVTRRFNWDETKEVMASIFKPDLKTSVIIHGFFESDCTHWIEDMTERLMNKEAQNVFVVDWEDGANNLNYYQSAINTRMVGALTALFLQELVKLGASPASFHLIGFSLGGQVAGEAGKRTSGLGRISGLDPAAFGFEGHDPEVRLDRTDADYVVVIHTESAIFNPTEGTWPAKGIVSQSGHLDFYPNCGFSQPGCAINIRNTVTQLLINGNEFSYLIACSHFRGYELFSSSLSFDCGYKMSVCKTDFDALGGTCTPCEEDQCPPSFGYDVGQVNGANPTGIFTFSTSQKWPFCCKFDNA